MGIFDELYDQATNAVKDVDLSQGTQALVNAYFQAQAAQVQASVKVGPDPAQAALLPTPISQATAAVSTAAKSIPPWLPIVALVGAGAYFMMKKRK